MVFLKFREKKTQYEMINIWWQLRILITLKIKHAVVKVKKNTVTKIRKHHKVLKINILFQEKKRNKNTLKI